MCLNFPQNHISYLVVTIIRFLVLKKVQPQNEDLGIWSPRGGNFFWRWVILWFFRHLQRASTHFHFFGACSGLLHTFILSAPAAGYYAILFFWHLRPDTTHFDFFGAWGGLLIFQKLSAPAAGFVFFQNCSAPAASSFLGFVGACGGLCFPKRNLVLGDTTKDQRES